MEKRRRVYVEAEKGMRRREERMWRSGEDFGHGNAYLLLSARHRMIRPGGRSEKR
jgi:hypothetical protein